MKLPSDLLAFIGSLNAAKVKYVIVGGYAVAYHGHPRFTGDIDFFIEPSEENAARVIQAMDLFGFSSLGLSVKDFTNPDAIVQLGYPPNRIDVMTQVDGVSFEEAWNTRETSAFDGEPVAFISRDLLIQNKKASGRARDLGDLENL